MIRNCEHYLRIGAKVPLVEIVATLKHAPRDERLAHGRRIIHSTAWRII